MLILSGPPVNQIASVVVCGTNELFTCFVVNTLHIPWITLLFTLKSVIFGSKSHSYSPGVRADHTLIHPKNVRSHSYSPQKWGGGADGTFALWQNNQLHYEGLQHSSYLQIQNSNKALSWFFARASHRWIWDMLFEMMIKQDLFVIMRVKAIL